MEKSLTSNINKKYYYYRVFSVVLIGVIPIISHTFSLPLYYIEPMRILVILFFIKGYFKDAVILSFVYPLFSFIITGHPIIFKAPLVGLDLFLNVFLFYVFLKKDFNKYFSFIFSIISSKTIYYILKFIIYKAILNNSESIIETNIIIQATNILLLLFLLKFFNKKNHYA